MAALWTIRTSVTGLVLAMLVGCGSHGASGDPDAVEDADGPDLDALADLLDVESDDASGEDSVCEDTLYPCGGSCVDLSTDVGNCGVCGGVCGYMPHASPGCLLGECVPSCDAGWADIDNVPENGCEAEDA